MIYCRYTSANIVYSATVNESFPIIAMKLDIKAFALALGLLWTAAIFIMALLDMSLGFGSEWVALVGTVYKGYGPNLQGAFIGMPWAFIDAFIGGLVFAWLYNKLAKQ